MNRKSVFFRVCDRLSILTLCLFALECVLGCSGRWLSFGSFSIRMVLFVLCFFFTLPNVFCRLRTLIRSPFLLSAVLFGLYMVIAAFIGWKRQNNPSYIVADITGVLTLALIPGFLATVGTKERLHCLTEVVFWGALVLGIATTVMHICFAFTSDYTINRINLWLNEHHMGGFSFLQTGMQRIYLRSQIFLQAGLLFGLYKCWCISGWKRWLILVGEGIILFACLLSLTRGFWLGFAGSAVLLLVLCPRFWKKYLVTVGVVSLVIIGLLSISWLSYGKPVAAQELVYRFNPAWVSGALLPSDPGAKDPVIDPTTPTDPNDPTDPTDPTDEVASANQAAVDIRKETLLHLNVYIRNHPLFGNGLGTQLQDLRDGGKTEYMYQDLIMKLGFVGFLLFMAAYFLPSFLLLKKAGRRLLDKTPAEWDDPSTHNAVLVSAYLGVALTSYVNPFLTNPMGILLLLLTAAAASQEVTKKPIVCNKEI